MNVGLGGTFGIGDSATVLQLNAPVHGNGPQRGTLVNRMGSDRVFVQMDADDVEATAAAATGKFWLDEGESLRIPAKCGKLALKCAATESATVLYVEA